MPAGKRQCLDLAPEGIRPNTTALAWITPQRRPEAAYPDHRFASEHNRVDFTAQALSLEIHHPDSEDIGVVRQEVNARLTQADIDAMFEHVNLERIMGCGTASSSEPMDLHTGTLSKFWPDPSSGI